MTRLYPCKDSSPLRFAVIRALCPAVNIQYMQTWKEVSSCFLCPQAWKQIANTLNSNTQFIHSQPVLLLQEDVT